MARVGIWSHDSNPYLDRPLLRKSESYARQLVISGEARRIRSDAIQLYAPLCQSSEILISAHGEVSSNSCISEHEMQANAGVADTQSEIQAAQDKVRAYMSLGVVDDKSPLPGGQKWPVVPIRVTVLQ